MISQSAPVLVGRVVGFALGVLILVRPPQDLVTLAVHVAAFGLLLGILRVMIAFRVRSPDLI